MIVMVTATFVQYGRKGFATRVAEFAGDQFQIRITDAFVDVSIGDGVRRAGRGRRCVVHERSTVLGGAVQQAHCQTLHLN